MSETKQFRARTLSYLWQCLIGRGTASDTMTYTMEDSYICLYTSIPNWYRYHREKTISMPPNIPTILFHLNAERLTSPPRKTQTRDQKSKTCSRMLV